MATNAARRTVTNELGYYTVTALDPGEYRVTAQKNGFKTLLRSGIVLQVNQKLALDLILAVGDVGETVSVHAEPPLVDSASASLGAVMEERKILDLPLNGRN